MTMISESEPSRLRTWPADTISAIGAMIMTKQRHDHSGNADEDEDRLPLAGDQVEIPHRLGEPDHHGQGDQRDQERNHGSAEYVSADRPHRSRAPRRRPITTADRPPPHGAQGRPHQCERGNAFTKWPRQGNPIATNRKGSAVKAGAARGWEKLLLPDKPTLQDRAVRFISRLANRYEPARKAS